MRWPFVGLLAVVSVFGLFWLMHKLVLPPEDQGPRDRATATIAVAPPPPEQGPEEDAMAEPVEAPAAPPDMPSISLTMDVAMPVNLEAAESTELSIAPPKVKVSGSAAGVEGFAGFASGGGGSGVGRGQRVNGKKLVPLSTARPQIPRDAYEAGVEGWVEAVFFIGTNGRVSNIRIVDADPKGVFEAAMIESIRNWIYPVSDSVREVQQRFEFKLEDYQYNWN